MNIDHIAKLSRLKIQPDQYQKIETDMEAIVSMVEDLPDIDTNIDLLEPYFTSELREDISNPNKFTSAEILANAPNSRDNCFVIPKIVE